MKKFVVLLLVLVSVQAFADDIKSKDVKLEVPAMPGIIEQLGADKTFRFDAPSQLDYWSATTQLPAVNDKIDDMLAKQVYAKKPADYVFTYVGKFNYVGHSEPQASPVDGGMVVSLQYNFSCKIEVRQGDVLLKTIVLDDGSTTHTTIFHPDFLTAVDVNNVYNSYDRGERLTRGFPDAQAEAVMARIEKKEPAILQRMEYNAYARQMYLAKALLTVGYGENKPGRTLDIRIETLEKKSKEAYPELNTRIDQLCTDIVSFYSGGKYDELQAQFTAAGDYIVSQYDAKTSPKEMKRLCAMDAAFAYAFGGQMDKSYQQFKIADDLYGVFGQPPYAYKGNIDKIAAVHLLLKLKNEATMDCTGYQTLAMWEKAIVDEKYAAEMAANAGKKAEALAVVKERASHNLDNQPGILVTSDNKEFKGKVTFEALEMRSSNIANTDLGRVITFYPENGKGRYYKPNKVKYFEVTNEDGSVRHYEPIKEKSSVGLKILKVAVDGAAALSGSYFMERVYQNGDYEMYYLAQFDDYFLKRKSDDVGYNFYSLSGNTKNKVDFISGCPKAMELLDKGKFEDTKANCMQVVDALAACK